MEIETWYQRHFESLLQGRYIQLKHLEPLLDFYAKKFKIETVGHSVKGQKIVSITIGNGPEKVLAWSQMHGNESTTTKALFDFFAFISQEEDHQNTITDFLNNYTFCVIPILNPDGSAAYTRENANGIDLNRDAKKLSQPESKVLRDVFEAFQPDLCLNLHDQRTLYGLSSGKTATVSFLSPAANENRTVTKSRRVAMELISRMATVLSDMLPGHIGRYDDTFNENCVGDTFQSKSVPTILFEAGHYPGDYAREITRKYVFYAYLVLFGLYPEGEVDRIPYTSIPENEKNFRDIILRNVRFEGSDGEEDIALQYEEYLEGDKIAMVPVVDSVGKLSNYLGHKELDLEGAEILLNFHENVFEGEKVSTIVNKNANNQVFFKDSFDVF
ncbi:M14 family metallopeptidase [Aureisphaera galaxeae]|uniref:M14 family metallopeptidase n=1 Tax=Aureisphaera galaxeae TaxID=1538023 RepID=UPI00234FD0A9|nr:M14 metallopeptidase family protein [Aureisphaera galaxeae]MDC8004020.1 M14 family metallopeptidase [Aureisphaera galaxeae]